MPSTTEDRIPGVTNHPFPDSNWGREGVSLIAKPVFAFASTPLGSWVIRSLVPLDRRVMNRSRGRYTLFGPTNLPQLLLTTIGRKSGLPRKNPVSYLRDGDRLLVMGSNFGGISHPAWSSNLLENPDATAAMAGEDVPVSATQLHGTEREQAMAKFFAYPMYVAYCQRTDRNLRVFALTRR